VRPLVGAPGAALYSAIVYAHDPESMQLRWCVPTKRRKKYITAGP